jgi:hypothetical protein
MLNYDEITLAKIAELKRIKREFDGQLEVYELIKIHWLAPDNAITYCPSAVRPCQIRLTANFPNAFQQVPLNSALSDDQIDVEFHDFDNEFTRLFEANGEGTKVEVFLWCPQVELLLNIFQGHLSPAENADLYFWRGQIANGFRSPDMRCPGRGHFKTECQATFGGVLETQEEIDKGDCWYNRHLGGATGNVDGSGQPFNDRNDRQ